MTSTRRLFVGFPLEIGESLAAALKRTRISAQQKEMQFGWTPSANLHVTLNFLGDTDESRLEELRRVLAETAANEAPIETSLRGMGAFPDERHMRVLWVGVRKSRALAGLQDRLRDALIYAGFPQEDRAYVPHLTVGRLRKARSGTDLLSPYVRTSFGDIEISAITLFESVLHGAMTIYQPLERYELTGTPAVEDDESEPALATS